MRQWRFVGAFVIAAVLYLGITVLGAVLPVVSGVTAMCTFAAGALVGRYAPHPLYAILAPFVLVLSTVALGVWGTLLGSENLSIAVLSLVINQSLSAAVLLAGSFTGYVAV